MQNGWEFFWTVVASSAGTSLLLGLAAWLFKSQIGHWLNKDLEATKAGYQQELEAYKVSLISQVEKTKAEQDIRKAMALKAADMQFSAMERLSSTSSEIHGQVIAFVLFAGSYSSERYESEWLAKRKGCVDLGSAMAMAGLFISQPEKVVLSDFLQALNIAIISINAAEKHILNHNLQTSIKQELIDKQAAVYELVRRHITDMYAMNTSNNRFA